MPTGKDHEHTRAQKHEEKTRGSISFAFPAVALSCGRDALRAAARQPLVVGCLTLLAVALAGCSRSDTEDRARKAAEKIKESIPDVEAKALAQKATPEQVKRAQESLIVAKEYMGQADGRLDPVTVNAIEAFQRAHGLRDDGMLNERTEKLLQQTLGEK